MRKFSFIYTALAALALLVSCTQEKLVRDPSSDGRIVFRTWMGATPTKAVAGYSAVARDYNFNIGMYQSGVAGELDNGNYAHTTDDVDGVLNAVSDPLYWPGNVEAYGFKATARGAFTGAAPAFTDQTTLVKLRAQDLLTGYAYAEVKEDGSATDDDIEALNYHTSKNWYARATAAGATDPKVIPLYMQHDRSLLTIILKAGVGVDREALAFVANNEHLMDTIFSYAGSPTEATKIIPYASEQFVDYDEDENGPAQTHVSTTQFDAIVSPYDYLSHPNDILTRINLDGMKYSYSSRGDKRYALMPPEMQCYNLKAGEHLTVTVELTNTGHIVLITAVLEPWSDVITTTVVNDFGMNGDPFLITNRASLIEYLTNPLKNKSGNIAIVQSNEINLDYPDDWSTAIDPADAVLRSNINLAGATFKSKGQVFSAIDAGGSLQNGTIVAMDAASAPASFVCGSNAGIIEDINLVLPEDGEATCTSAGFALTNTGEILNCKSVVPVMASSCDYAGGIAAVSSGRVWDCEMGACVKGTPAVAGGGIVGSAEDGAVVSGCKFDYGITVSQDPAIFKNIIGASSGTITASDNAWPTYADNSAAGSNVSTKQHEGIIDCREDLEQSFTANVTIAGATEPLNSAGNSCLIVKDFTIDNATTWTYTDKNLHYSLLGDDHVITLTNSTTGGKAQMLFNKVDADVSDITVHIMKTISPEPSNSSAASGFAYAIDGAEIRNIKVSTNPATGTDATYIKAANVGGVAVWAYGGATITNCEFYGKVSVQLGGPLYDGQCYCGGIVCMAANATVDACVCHLTTPTERDDMTLLYDESIYYGGIVGTVYNKIPGGEETPALLITNCTSNDFISLEETGEMYINLRAHSGAIIGDPTYKVSSGAGTDDIYGIVDGCVGNWWHNKTQAVSRNGCTMAHRTETDIVGLCNAVKPALDDSWK